MLIILFIVKNFLILVISFKRKQALLRSNLPAIKADAYTIVKGS
jgi:hypothetical protein